MKTELRRQIPIRNIWLLMLYASDIHRLLGPDSIGSEENPDELPDLISEILLHAVEERIRRNLTRGYRSVSTEVTRLRGKIDLLKTERKQLLNRGRIHCRFEELTSDTHRNRFVLMALEKVSTLVRDRSLATRCRQFANRLRLLGVSSVLPSRTELSLDQVSRNNMEDQLMLSAAHLAHQMTIPNAEKGYFSIKQPEKDERWLRNLFEKAVAGFYKVVATPIGWSVQPGKWLNWQIDHMSSGMLAILPKMKTDIYLENRAQGRRIIIDAKFNKVLVEGYYRDFSIRSAYIYQIYSYLRSQVRSEDPLSQVAEGMILHPDFGRAVDENVCIQGHNIKFATIDLTKPALTIRQNLLVLLN